MSRDFGPVPKPTVDCDYSEGELTLGNVEAMLCKPVYASVGPYPALIDDETWVRAAAKAMEEQGVEQWLVNMLHTLQASLAVGE